MQVDLVRSEVAPVVAGPDADDTGTTGGLDAGARGLLDGGEIESVHDDFSPSCSIIVRRLSPALRMTSIACRVCGATRPCDFTCFSLDTSVIMSYHVLSLFV